MELGGSLAIALGESLEQPRVLICFCHLRWNFVYQRPQHLLSRAAASFDTYVFEEPLSEDVEVPHLRRVYSREGVTVLTPVMSPRLSPDARVVAQRELLDMFLRELSGERIVGYYYTPMALEFSRHVPLALCVYDNMDELSAFRNAPPRLLELEEELLARADVVFTGGQSLYRAKKNRHGNIHAFPSSIDTAHFEKARGNRLPAPEDQSGIPRPRIGFFGVMDERLDIELFEQVAKLRPQWQFVMLGPVVKIDPASLPQRPNIHWLGGKSYLELPAYLAGWDVGIMPFALNESTRFISPTKTPEFLAAGLPVVSTPIADVVDPYGKLGLVRIASDTADFVEAISESLKPAPAAWRTQVDRYLARNSWDLTWARMKTLMLRAGGWSSQEQISENLSKESRVV
jgi:glycosyltransferase involved in cell wall biosynthesis